MPAGNVEERARPRSVQVRDELSHRIDRGLLPAGSRLPSEPALATELGVSRATLREALRALENEGLVRRMWGAVRGNARALAAYNIFWTLPMNFMNIYLPVYMKERGLTLSPEKTLITHIEEGFDFLGQVRPLTGKGVARRATHKQWC